MSDNKKFTDEELDAIWKEMLKPEKRKPLTLEDFKKMNGKPVYYKTAKQWFIVELNHPDFGDCVMNTSGQYIPLEKAAMRNRFYAYEPHRLDRSEWEPCALCKRLGEPDPCYKYGCFRKNAPQCDYRCDQFLEWMSAQRRLENAKFCPECSRPLTDAAWNMLEKRLEKM